MPVRRVWCVGRSECKAKLSSTYLNPFNRSGPLAPEHSIKQTKLCCCCVCFFFFLGGGGQAIDHKQCLPPTPTPQTFVSSENVPVPLVRSVHTTRAHPELRKTFCKTSEDHNVPSDAPCGTPRYWVVWRHFAFTRSKII